VVDERAERGREAALRARDHLGDGQRAGDRPVLRHQLADHHQHDGGDDHAQHGRHGRGRAAQSCRLQGASEEHGQRGFGEHADHQRGDGDAQLGPGQLERQPSHRLQRALGAPLARLGGPLQVTALDGGQGELGRHEQRAGEREQQGEQEQQDLGHRATPDPSRMRLGPGMARLVLGGSPIAEPSLLTRIHRNSYSSVSSVVPTVSSVVPTVSSVVPTCPD
jgi:hypothetical protein